MPQELPLRDIHLPDAISWWPPAIGWWLLLLLLIVAIGVAFYQWRKPKSLPAPPIVLRDYWPLLSNTVQQFEHDNNPQQLLQRLSSLLRQIAIEQNPDAAGLTGQGWLLHLDTIFNNTDYSQGIGQVFATQTYQAQTEFDCTAMIRLLENSLSALQESRHA